MSEENSAGSGWRLIPWEKLKHPPEMLVGWIYVLASIYLGFAAWMFFSGCLELLSTAPDDAHGKELVFAAGAMAAAPFVVWRIYTSHVQAKANQEQARIAQENHITELLAKATEFLGSTLPDGMPNTEHRLGGILTLSRVANESERDRWKICQLLAAYVRKHSPAKIRPFDDYEWGIDGHRDYDTVSDWLNSHPMLGQDVQSAIDAISEIRRDANERIDLRFVNFRYASLNGKSLSNSELHGSLFYCSEAISTDFSNADLSKTTILFSNLTGANLTNAKTEQMFAQSVIFDKCIAEYIQFNSHQLDRLPDKGDEFPCSSFAGVNYRILDDKNYPYADADR